MIIVLLIVVIKPLAGPYITPKNLNNKFSVISVYETQMHRNYSREFIIEETNRFMERGVDEEDIELIEFVQTIINPPSNKDYQLTIPNQPGGDYSQYQQSAYIDGILKQRTGGFYIGINLRC